LDIYGNVAGGSNMNSVTAYKTVYKAGGYLYSGVENSNECWCGNVIHGIIKSLNNCSMSCTGNFLQICGGPNRISIYQQALLSSK
jgi:hypothetical protein